MTCRSRTRHRVLSTLLLATLAASCGDRPLPVVGTDGGPSPDGWSKRDAPAGREAGGNGVCPPGSSWCGPPACGFCAPDNSGVYCPPSCPDAGLPPPDACVPPPGYCHTTADCPQPGPFEKYECRGCYGDPCCPMCDVCASRCELVKTCASNAHCGQSELCNLDGICFLSGPLGGTCEPRPQGCPANYDPVCGCDGKVYPNNCVAHNAGVSVKSKGACNEQACLGLESQYLTALASAKTCCADCQMIQCTLKVKDKLRCSCETFVEATQPAVNTLQSLEAQWYALGCGQLPILCSPVMCSEPLQGTCASSGSGTGGTCHDLYGG